MAPRGRGAVVADQKFLDCGRLPRDNESDLDGVHTHLKRPQIWGRFSFARSTTGKGTTLLGGVERALLPACLQRQKTSGQECPLHILLVPQDVLQNARLQPLRASSRFQQNEERPVCPRIPSR